jgi:hypothetical protein
MGKVNWRRIFLCGLVAGLIWSLLSAVILTFLGADLLTAVPQLYAPKRGLLLFSFIVNLAMGSWAMWLYAAIRPRYGPGPRTAAVAGFAWWMMYCLAKANWGPFGLVKPKVLLTLLAADLPALFVAAVVGARYYEE